jgi:HD superfamily phosphohydrolase
MYTSIYTNKVPAFINEFANTSDMKRLSDVGMHCGCEYADFPIYRKVKCHYTRFMHSIGVANIVWNFTQDMKQTVAALLHDISTPTFAHTIDFLNDDYIAQESTEDDTLSFIQNSKSITALLEKYSIKIDEVSDYSKYPIADNDTPLLSADRLEYTIGNGYIVHDIDLCELADIYNDLTIVKNELGIDELCFKSIKYAVRFVKISLQNSYWFVSDEDRFSMKYLADMVKTANEKNVLLPDDLLTTESRVIEKLKNHSELSEMWDNFTKISKISVANEKIPDRYCVNIPAKKRYINPLVHDGSNIKRITDIDVVSRELIEKFLSLDFNKWIYVT